MVCALRLVSLQIRTILETLDLVFGSLFGLLAKVALCERQFNVELNKCIISAWHLRKLDFTGLGIGNIAALAQSRLTTLILQHTDVGDLSFLEEHHCLGCSNICVCIEAQPTLLAKSLRKLDLSFTHVTEFTVLRHCSGLQELDLSSTDVAEFTVLRHFSRLLKLSVAFTTLTSLEDLQGLTAL